MLWELRGGSAGCAWRGIRGGGGVGVHASDPEEDSVGQATGAEDWATAESGLTGAERGVDAT